MKSFPIVLYLFFLLSLNSSAQINLEIEGNAQIRTMEEDNCSPNLLIHQADGSLAIRDIKTWSPSSVETEKTLPYTANWEDYGSSFKPGTYYYHEGRVYLDGLVRKTSGGPPANGDIICTLPLGYRPPNRIVTRGLQNEKSPRLDVFPNGDVYISAGLDNINDWISLEGLSFAVH